MVKYLGEDNLISPSYHWVGCLRPPTVGKLIHILLTVDYDGVKPLTVFYIKTPVKFIQTLFY